MTCQKLFCPKNVWFKKFFVENDSAPKMFWVQRNLGFKEIEKFGSFKIIAHRFLIKTNVGKSLGAERFGPKQFGSRKKLSPKKSWSKKVWIQKNYGSTKFWVHKILAPKKIWVQIFLNFVSKKNCRSKKDCVKQNLVQKILIKINQGLQKLCPKSFVKIGSVTAEIFLIWANSARTNVSWTNVTMTLKSRVPGTTFRVWSELGQ